jgi:Ricin-type beta-trefoil lectin domain-like
MSRTGILSGGDNGLPVCERPILYSEVTAASQQMGITVARSSETFASVKGTFNGNPGYVVVGGNVYSGNTAISNVKVSIDLWKWENNNWIYKETVQPTVTGNSYQTGNVVVGKGLWRAKTVFLGQGSIAGSESDFKEFTIKDGYQLVAKHSGKCLDVYSNEKGNGAQLHQWDCLNPSQYLSQVYTLVPQGSRFQLVARHSNRCVDVTNGSQLDGARLQQWHCLGAGQTNQIWEGVPSSTPGYVNFRAQHSGKCIDVAGGNPANGTAVNQWGCGSGAHQQWTFKSVESVPAPTNTDLTMDSVMHGQPGYVSFHGNVDAAAYPVSSVNVNFQREVGPNSWETIPGATKVLSLSNGSYSYNYHALGAGQWRARAVFPGNPPVLAGSESPYRYFEVKRGYRFIVRHSEKCMSLSENKYNNGQAIIQWPCSANPSPGDGQVFTFVPMDFGYFNLKINHSSQNKCVDVTGGSSNNGAWLQAWDCYGPSQSNQIWQRVLVSGNWYAFIAKHSGKCADVSEVSQKNGARLHQWDCHWGGNQQWDLEGTN